MRLTKEAERLPSSHWLPEWLANGLTMLAKIMVFDEEHNSSIKLFVSIDYSKEVSRVSLSEYLRDVHVKIVFDRRLPHCQNIFECRLKQVTELLLSDQLEQRGFQRVFSYVVEELHCTVLGETE
jgi:hypothetical protein